MFVASSPKNMEGVGPLPTLVAYTCGGGVAKGYTYTLVVQCWSHTPAMDKCLRDVPKACHIYLWWANV